MSLTELAVAYLWLSIAINFAVFVWIHLRSEQVLHAEGRTFYDLKKALRHLLRSGFHRGSLSIRDPESQRVMRFEKYIRDTDQLGIKLVLPLQNISERHLSKILEFCKSKSVSFRTLRGRRGGSDCLLHVNFGKDIESAKAFAIRIWLDIFGSHELAEREFDWDRIAKWGQTVDRPGLTQLSRDEIQRRHVGPKGPSYAFLIFRTLLSLIRYFSGVGLALSLLAGLDHDRGWSVHLAQIELGGTTSSLVFFIFYLGAIVVQNAAVSWLGIEFAAKRWLRDPFIFEKIEERVVPVMNLTNRICLPLSAFIIWSGT